MNVEELALQAVEGPPLLISVSSLIAVRVAATFRTASRTAQHPRRGQAPVQVVSSCVFVQALAAGHEVEELPRGLSLWCFE